MRCQMLIWNIYCIFLLLYGFLTWHALIKQSASKWFGHIQIGVGRNVCHTKIFFSSLCWDGEMCSLFYFILGFRSHILTHTLITLLFCVLFRWVPPYVPATHGGIWLLNGNNKAAWDQIWKEMISYVNNLHYLDVLLTVSMLGEGSRIVGTDPFFNINLDTTPASYSPLFSMQSGVKWAVHTRKDWLRTGRGKSP